MNAVPACGLQTPETHRVDRVDNTDANEDLDARITVPSVLFPSVPVPSVPIPWVPIPSVLVPVVPIPLVPPQSVPLPAGALVVVDDDGVAKATQCIFEQPCLPSFSVHTRSGPWSMLA